MINAKYLAPVLATGLLLGACSNSEGSAPEENTTTTAEAPTTSELMVTPAGVESDLCFALTGLESAIAEDADPKRRADEINDAIDKATPQLTIDQLIDVRGAMRTADLLSPSPDDADEATPGLKEQAYQALNDAFTSNNC